MDKFDIAKKFFAGNAEKKIKALDALKIMLENKFTLKDSLQILIDKKIKANPKSHPDTNILTPMAMPEYLFYKSFLQSLAEGKKVSTALDGWLSSTEVMLISTGENKDLPTALKLTVELMESIKDITSTAKKTFMMPLFLIFALGALLYGFANSMSPILVDLLEVEQWPDSGKKLYSVTQFIYTKWMVIILSFAGVGFTIVKTFPIWVGTVRYKFDKFVPWSIYKEISASTFIISLATLMQAGVKLDDALRGLRGKSSKYVAKEISIMIQNLAEVKESGMALTKNTNFLGEAGDDIEILSKAHDFPDAMLKVGTRNITEKQEDLKAKGDKIKTMITLVLFAIVGWIVTTFMDITTIIQEVNEKGME